MNMHEKYMATLYDALAKHPEVDIDLVDIVEAAELDYFNKHDRHEWRDIYKHHTTKIDIINNFEEYKEMCQDEIWDMLERRSRELVESTAKGVTIIGVPYDYESLEKCLLDTDAVEAFRNLHESMMKQANRVRDYYHNGLKEY